MEAQSAFGDKFFYAKRQLIWAVFGVISLTVLSQIPYQFFQRLALPIFIVVLILLFAVLIPSVGSHILGARRWISFGSFAVQPSEFAKFALVLYSAYVFAKKKPLRYFFGAVILVMALVMLEPDLGTTIIIGAAAAVLYFASGAPLTYFLVGIPAGVLGIIFLALTSPYRRNRILTFLDPSSDPLGTSYHIRQVIIALGSGGLFGLGLGQSRQKYLFLPEPTTDSIFAIIGEELGFIGACVFIGAFLFFVWRGFLIASRIKDPFGRLLAAGITGWIGSQAFINLGAMVALLPLAGVPLPFVSYGGSSLLAALSGIGVLLNISRYQEKIR